MERERLVRILSALGAGLTTSEITSAYEDLTIADIAEAAKEALRLVLASASDASSSDPGTFEAYKELARRDHPRAYMPWSIDEDTEVSTLCASGTAMDEIARHVGRRPSASESRLRRLGLDPGVS